MDDEQFVDEGAGVELVDDGMGGSVPASMQDQSSDDSDPWRGVPDEVRELAQKKGFKSVSDIARSYQEMERSHTRLSQQMAESRREQEPEPSRRPTQPSQDGVDFEAIVDAAGGDPAIALALYDQHVAGPRLQSMLEEALGNFEQSKIAPLSQVAGSMYWRNEANELRSQHPEEFDKYAGEIEDIFVNDPSLAERPDGMRVAFERVMGRHAMSRMAQSRASQINAGGRGGGRPAKDVDPAQAVRDAIRGAQGFGGDRNIG